MQTQNLYKGCVFHHKISVSSKFEYGSVLNQHQCSFSTKKQWLEWKFKKFKNFVKSVFCVNKCKKSVFNLVQGLFPSFPYTFNLSSKLKGN